ncbi:unnamed protein product [Urochloa decumbens]|uniref:Uncharacterized protein n=1 Tax=Urochloa decumbens TaxID=240449 RepID=A0ABC9DED0_9POAL
MDILEHPFEAVAFRLYSLPDSSAATGAAAWTCLAAVLAAAAAAGLWRLRASSAVTAAAAATKPMVLDPIPAEVAPAAPSRAPERWPEPAAASAAPSPKERYTAYFNDTARVGCCCDDAGGEDQEDDAEEHDGDDAFAYRTAPEATTDHFVGWEEVVRTLPLSPTAPEMEMRLGRYRSPRAAIGGSVVQLWDQVAGGGLTPTASPRRRGRVVATAPAF